jgi:molybdenum cofactor cytidylyltransferase
VVENDGWEEGIASSIRCGLNALLEIMPDIEHAIFMVCDQPFVTARLLNELVEVCADTGSDIVACAYGGTVGTPALFSKNYFPALLELQGDEGAKKLLKQYSDAVGVISFPKGDIDIDTMKDYEEWKNSAG